jgi:enamine deaminase RidA (YjgF/YER057c/UK114 family)
MAHESQVRFLVEPVERALGFAAVVEAGGFLHLSGIVSVDETAMNVIGEGDMAAQLNRIYDIMEQLLARSQASLRHVVKETIFATDLAALGAAVGVRNARYGDNAPPATTAVEVKALFFPTALVEIEAVAYIGG